MKDAFKKVAISTLLAANALTFGYGTYITAKTSAREYITQKADYDQAKACIETIKADGECNRADYAKVGRMVENEREFGLGLAITFASSVSFGTLIPLAAGQRRRKEDAPKKDEPKDAPKP